MPEIYKKKYFNNPLAWFYFFLLFLSNILREALCLLLIVCFLPLECELHKSMPFVFCPCCCSGLNSKDLE